MNKTDKRKHCLGCRQDFYNGKNDLGVAECWMLKSARLISRVRVGINERPPWTSTPQKRFDCYQQSGVIWMSPENVKDNNAACMAAIAREEREKARAVLAEQEGKP